MQYLYKALPLPQIQEKKRTICPQPKPAAVKKTIRPAADDVIKFRVAITEKKVPALIVAKTAPVTGADAWMLPYSTQKSIACVTGKVKDVSKVAGEYHYYTLSMHMKDKMVSCPVMNAEGQVFGIAQKSSGIDTVTTCYAAGAAFAMSQKISALSLGDAALKSIGIRKGLPETEDQALVYLFMASSSLSGEDYEKLLDDFQNIWETWTNCNDW